MLTYYCYSQELVFKNNFKNWWVCFHLKVLIYVGLKFNNNVFLKSFTSITISRNFELGKGEAIGRLPQVLLRQKDTLGIRVLK